MKLGILGIAIFSALQAQAESISCLGQTNDPNTTPMKFELQLVAKPDKDIPNQMRYKSTVQFTQPDGSTLIQGIDLADTPRLLAHKIIYSSQSASLELTFAADGALQSSILDSPLSSIHMVSLQCSIQGKLPERPVCADADHKDSALIDAIRIGNTDLINNAIECGANVNSADVNDCTPLMFSIDSNCGDVGPKHTSSIMNPKNIIDALISQGAYVNVTNKAGDTPLLMAAKLGVRDVYESFLGAEANFDAQDSDGSTALMAAAYSGDVSIVQDILLGNPDRRLKNKAGLTAFDIATQWQKTEVIDLVRIPDLTVAISGKADGSCTPLKIELKLGQVIELKLIAAGKEMFRFQSPSLNLDFMADGGTTSQQIVSLSSPGVFPFTCGFHGSSSASHGEITVK